MHTITTANTDTVAAMFTFVLLISPSPNKMGYIISNPTELNLSFIGTNINVFPRAIRNQTPRFLQKRQFL